MMKDKRFLELLRNPFLILGDRAGFEGPNSMLAVQGLGGVTPSGRLHMRPVVFSIVPHC